MGCDGGTIPRRNELVRTRRPPEQKDRDSVRAFKCRHCALTQAPLELPAVACRLGSLFSKSSLLEVLLAGKHAPRPPVVQHVRSMKDVRQLRLTEAREGCGAVGSSGGAVKGAGYVDTQAADFVCPVMGVEMNGRYRFVVLWRCGCVLSERALKMAGSDQCPSCAAVMSTGDDVVSLNPDAEELRKMREALETQRARARADKKKTTKNKLTEPTESGQTVDPSSSEAVCDAKSSIKEASTSSNVSLEPQIKKAKTSAASSSSSSSSSASASSSAKSRPGPSINLPNDGRLADPEFSKTSQTYSVATDSEKTEVYKSLFTSHETALKQPRAHWVTYNPLYN